jgi:hypothetical protein
MVLKYLSGEEIRKGDRVLFHREPGEIEFVVDKLTGDAAVDWYMHEFGGGVMIRSRSTLARFLFTPSRCRRQKIWNSYREPVGR